MAQKYSDLITAKALKELKSNRADDRIVAWRPIVDTSNYTLDWELSSSTIKPNAITLKGPTGDSGPKGDTGPTGYATLPRYSAQDNSLIWGVVNSTKDLISLQGPKGDTGPAGPIGPTGPIKLGSPFPYLQITYNAASIRTTFPYYSSLFRNEEYRNLLCYFLENCACYPEKAQRADTKDLYQVLDRRLQ